MSVSSDVALIVPVLDDADALATLLAAVAGWAFAPREIVVVAAGADERVEAVCREHACRLVRARANRGAQLDRGARSATAPVLWFVHADATPWPHSLQAITAALAEGAEGGCFRFRFQGEATWYKQLIAWLVAIRVRCGGVPYGDQGLFAHREAYLECGGFPHQPLFEEVPLVKCLRRRGTFRLLPESIGVSTRRWERDGWLVRTARNRWLALCYGLGVPAERLSHAYRKPVGTSKG